MRYLKLPLTSFSRGSPSKRDKIEALIWERYGKMCSVLVIDLKGFAKSTHTYGIVHYLSLITKMQAAVEDIMLKHSGFVVKFEADNCFVLFYNSAQAVKASIELNRLIAKDNRHISQKDKIEVSCGIGYGKILHIREDIFGNEINKAAKLSEDYAKGGQIFVTSLALKNVTEVNRDFNNIDATDFEVLELPERKRVGDIRIEAFEIHY